MLDSRTQNETGVFEGFELEVSVRLFEHRQLALAHDLRRGQLSFMQGDPGNGVIVRRARLRLVADEFTGPMNIATGPAATDALPNRL